MDVKKLKLAIKQAQKVCNRMNKCANKFILQDSINEMNQVLTIPDSEQQRELLQFFCSTTYITHDAVEQDIEDTICRFNAK
jgi:hypothetical protein